jgi:hypothetical protein
VFKTKLDVGPPTVATTTPTGPVVEPGGTVATICVSLQLTTSAFGPVAFAPAKKWTVLLLCDGPKPVPVIVTVAPTGAIAGDTAVTVGAPSTVNDPLAVALY